MTYSNKPISIELDIGKRVFCTCGQSDKKPFCDGSHPDTSWPHPIDIIRNKPYMICDCGLTANAPFCDGAHNGGDSG